ncbi:hypothetical protein [Rhodococcus sp. MEB064]|uniref:hypothetical protein n=1 Tax=Rhodococcus sp. MEB064 TaxID=1587522 RepID=UPI000696A075|nr:hypothetical protein [Rhodococcus sp. MEB064]
MTLPADMRRVIGRWSPDSLDALSRPRARSGVVAVLSAPGMSERDVRRAVESAGWAVVPVASGAAVIVLLDPDLPVGRALIESVRAVPLDLPIVVVVPAADHEQAARIRSAVAALAPRCASAPVVVPSVDGPSALVETVERAVGRIDDAEVDRLLRADALASARSALAAAARNDTGVDEIAALRERRRRVLVDAGTGDGRTSSGELRIELAHRVGVHRRETAARVSEAVASARRADLRQIPAGVMEEIDAASARLTAEVDAAFGRRGAVGTVIAAGGSSTDQPAPPGGRWTSEDVLAGIVGASAGAGVGRAGAWAMSVGGLLASVVAVLGAVSMATAVVGTRATASSRARLRRWAIEVVADAAATWERDIASRILAADASAADLAVSRARDRAARRDAALADVDAEIRDVSSRAASRAAAYQRDLEILERGTDDRPRASKHENG